MPRTKGAKGKHNKEKPIKEKKKRGRPSKQHQKQHQQQKQIVNVNVNGGGGGGGSKNTTIPVPFQLPSTIYDPSLITPHYGINDRQPTNPLTDAATDLMTPFIQSLISNQAQKVSRIPISEGDVKPVNPINPKTPTQAIPISQGDVKPVNPVIPKPPERYVPNPQTDQSHPIPPEIITDSNFSSLIHNKHMQHKNLQKEITPQVPKIPQPKKKINDPEGLGKIIPFGNIETIAGTVGTAALTGGSSVALEALYTGGTAGLMGAGESILGAGIGSGVAAGVSSAFGNSAIGNVISGAVGGVVGRAAGKAAANRRTRPQGTTEEQIPLLGNRLGGRRGRNRLVQETQSTYDPATGETTTWQIPEQQPPPTTLSIIKKMITKRMKNASDRINNLSQQIRGRNSTPLKGTYAEIPMENVANYKKQQDVLKRFDEDMLNENRKKSDSQLYELIRRDNYDGNDPLDIEHFLKNRRQNTAATGIQKVVRGRKTRKQLPNLIEEADRQKIQNEVKNIFETEQKGNAATTIKNAIKSKQARTRLKQNRELKKMSDVVVDDMENQIRKQQEPFINAGVKLQTAARNRLARKELMKRSKEFLKNTPVVISTEPPRPSTQPMVDIVSDKFTKGVVKNTMNKIVEKEAINNAATTLQSAMRNRTAKRNIMKQRQLVGEEQLKQMEETQRQIESAKADTAKKKDIAAKQLQAISKRVKAQSDVSNIKKAKERIGAAAKGLLTEKVKSFYGPMTKKTHITNKNTVGQPLTVSKKLQLVSKKKHDAAVAGYENRQIFLDLAEQYKGIMTKGKRK